MRIDPLDLLLACGTSESDVRVARTAVSTKLNSGMSCEL